MTVIGVARDGGVVSRVGVPQYTEGPIGFEVMFLRNITRARRHDRARPAIRTVGLEEVSNGYRAMASREALKGLIRP